MRLSELVGKEIVNLYDGIKLGTVGETDLVLNSETGQVESIIIPNRNNLLNFWSEKKYYVIPWQAVKKIGSEVIIVEINQSAMGINLAT